MLRILLSDYISGDGLSIDKPNYTPLGLKITFFFLGMLLIGGGIASNFYGVGVLGLALGTTIGGSGVAGLIFYQFLSAYLNEKENVTTVHFHERNIGDVEEAFTQELEIKEKKVPKKKSLFRLNTPIKPLDQVTEDGFSSPIHGAAANGNLFLLRRLLRQGWELSIKTTDGKTPLQLAVYYKRANIVEYLVSVHGGSLDIK